MRAWPSRRRPAAQPHQESRARESLEVATGRALRPRLPHLAPVTPVDEAAPAPPQRHHGLRPRRIRPGRTDQPGQDFRLSPTCPAGSVTTPWRHHRSERAEARLMQAAARRSSRRPLVPPPASRLSMSGSGTSSRTTRNGSRAPSARRPPRRGCGQRRRARTARSRPCGSSPPRRPGSAAATRTLHRDRRCQYPPSSGSPGRAARTARPAARAGRRSQTATSSNLLARAVEAARASRNSPRAIGS